MSLEAWLAVTLLAALVLIGFNAFLAWDLHRRGTDVEDRMARRLRSLTDELRSLEMRMIDLEAFPPSSTTRPGGTNPVAPRTGRAPARPDLTSSLGTLRADSASEPKLIAIPSLEASPGDRDLGASSLKERHAAIWALADSGATPEVIARACGQPIGQIELVLGLRRQIDASKTSFSLIPNA